MIIGLSGFARVGKDEAAKALVGIGWQRVAFADKLREFLLALDPIVATDYDGYVRVSDVINKYGWDGYKESFYGPEIRKLLQRLGTECGRELISDTIWIDAALKSQSDNNIVITDVRFPNEAMAIRERGGVLVRIERPGVGPANDHYSEHALDAFVFNHYLHNTGSVEDLHRNIIALAEDMATNAVDFV